MAARLRWLLLPLWVVALYWDLVAAPNDAVLGASQRILYVHLAAAWTGALLYLVNFVCSVLYLWRRSRRADMLAGAAAEVGTVLVTATLVTGSIWARYAWNTWWTWDPRLTTTAVMWFLYVGYLMLRGTIDREETRAQVSAVVGVVAFLDVPLVFMAIRWWRSIHPDVIGPQGFNMPPIMVTALMLSLAAVMGWAADMVALRMRTEALRRRVASLARWHEPPVAEDTPLGTPS